MLKVTIKFAAGLIFLLLVSCHSGDFDHADDKQRHIEDSLSEKRIDSAYSAIKQNCDSLMVQRIPRMLEFLTKKDTTAVYKCLDTSSRYTDPDKKLEKVVRLLKADCDSNLLRETYRRWRLLQVPARHVYKRKKALHGGQHS